MPKKQKQKLYLAIFEERKKKQDNFLFPNILSEYFFSKKSFQRILKSQIKTSNFLYKVSKSLRQLIGHHYSLNQPVWVSDSWIGEVRLEGLKTFFAVHLITLFVS